MGKTFIGYTLSLIVVTGIFFTAIHQYHNYTTEQIIQSNEKYVKDKEELIAHYAKEIIRMTHSLTESIDTQ